MHPRRFACLLLGLWLCGTVLIAAVASINLRGVAELMQAAPDPAQQMFQSLGQGQARSLLRYQAAELNRTFFELWEITQIPLGLVLLATLALTKGSRLQLALTSLMVLSVAAARFLFTPELIGVGRLLDFESPNTAQLMMRQRFATFHGMYMVNEAVKLAAGAALAASLLYRRTRERRGHELRDEVDLVDHADHRHIYGR